MSDWAHSDPTGGRGLFLSFEGIDGSGKSTQARLLAEALRGRGRKVVLTREPGGAPGAEQIRRLLVEGDGARWSPETEILLFNAARRDHLERTILPALDAGKVVICDRFADSTRVYQGAVRAQLRGLVDQVHRLMIGVEPDLTLILDADPELALRRGLARGGAEDRFEGFGPGFAQRLRTGFLELARDYPQRCRVLDANRPVDVLAAEVLAVVERALSGKVRP